jgi:hypothetical protein
MFFSITTTQEFDMSNFNTTPVPTKVKSFADSYEPRTGVKSKRSAQQELFKETDDEETFELSCASASNGLKKPTPYEPRKLKVDVNLLTCNRTPPMKRIKSATN